MSYQKKYKLTQNDKQSVITPHVSDGCNTFDIVCEWVNVLPLSWTNGRTNERPVGQVEGYLGQVKRSRSKVKVTRSKKKLFKGVSTEYESEWERFRELGSKKWGYSWKMVYLTPYMNGRATTRGVFKAYVGFYLKYLFRPERHRYNWPREEASSVL